MSDADSSTDDQNRTTDRFDPPPDVNGSGGAEALAQPRAAETPTHLGLVKKSHKEVVKGTAELVKTIDSAMPQLASPKVREACSDVRLVSRFVEKCQGKDVDGAIIAAMQNNKEFCRAFSRIGSVVTEFSGVLHAIRTKGSSENLAETLHGLATDLRRERGLAGEAFRGVINDVTADDPDDDLRRSKALDVADREAVDLESRRVLDELRKVRDETIDVRDETIDARDRAEVADGHAQEAAGKIGIDSPGHYFHEYAREECAMADRLRLAAGVLLVLLTTGAAVLIFFFEQPTVADELVRLSVTIPIAVLAGYLVRESSRHRASGRWSAELAIKLHSLPAFLDGVGDGEKPEYRRAREARLRCDADSEHHRSRRDRAVRRPQRPARHVHRGPLSKARDALPGRNPAPEPPKE